MMVDLDELERLHNSATLGEWRGWFDSSENGVYIAVGDGADRTTFAHADSPLDGVAIIAAHNALPALLSELRAAREAVAALRDERALLTRELVDPVDWTRRHPRAVVAIDAYDATRGKDGSK